MAYAALHLTLDAPILKSLPRACALLVSLFGLTAVNTGCVHVYQPMTGLHDPVILDTAVANFDTLRLSVICDRGDLLSRGEARVLCQYVGTLFENQGAEVSTRVSDEGPDVFIDAVEEEKPAPEVDLEMVLSSRQVHTSFDPVSWALFYMSATVVPAVTERTFALDVVIRDGTGFLLVSDSLQGRIIRRAGVGVWATNKAMNRFFRSEDEQLTEETAGQDLSDDMYGQLSQLVFNAQMQWLVLQQAPPVSPER